LDITAPFLKDEIIHAKGCVIRIKKSDELHVYAVGVEFTSLDETSQATLQWLIENADIDDY